MKLRSIVWYKGLFGEASHERHLIDLGWMWTERYIEIWLVVWNWGPAITILRQEKKRLKTNL